MADSITEQIMKKAAQALSEITVANGYANTIASVQRHQQSGVDLATTPTILIREGDAEVDLFKSVLYPTIRRTLEWYAVVITRQDEINDPRSGAEILNSLVADIDKRVAASGNWDGLAIMTDPPAYLEVEVDATSPHLARGLRFTTSYEHRRDNPYAQ